MIFYAKLHNFEEEHRCRVHATKKGKIKSPTNTTPIFVNPRLSYSRKKIIIMKLLAIWKWHPNNRFLAHIILKLAKNWKDKKSIAKVNIFNYYHHYHYYHYMILEAIVCFVFIWYFFLHSFKCKFTLIRKLQGNLKFMRQIFDLGKIKS